ncbi:Aldo/keto reductase [Hypoxylon trugodes]|uniref:Aldo/keto reductase n=1 Tax=Hypoxylon trugodes TaxID=326681 RepID=UPI0021A0F684|nr:Aldo/keto reductase [Hypoxylon trugodes]KAI1386634.1 Aldo/keto reductase [Hypoxylon trugodes]
MAVKTPTVKLASGYEMPIVGFGIWKVPQETCADQVYNAIKLGYRHIDGAWDYGNSAEAGQGVRRAIEEGIVKREDVFITSKLWNNYHARDRAHEMAKLENEAWGLGYLDLFLIHFPVSQEFIPYEQLRYPAFWSDKEQTKVTPFKQVPIQETWKAIEELVQTKENPNGFVKSIGVSNFQAQLIYDVLSYAKIHPSVLQIEHHPYLTQPDLIALARENNITVTGYSTFGPQSFLEMDHAVAKTIKPLFETDAVKSVATKHGKSPGQVLLRWCTQRGIIVIPKSNSVERLKQNLESSTFDLSEDEIKQISALNVNLRFNNPPAPIRIFA